MKYDLWHLWVTVLYNCNLYHIIHQLYFNIKKSSSSSSHCVQHRKTKKVPIGNGSILPASPHPPVPHILLPRVIPLAVTSHWRRKEEQEDLIHCHQGVPSSPRGCQWYLQLCHGGLPESSQMLIPADGAVQGPCLSPQEQELMLQLHQTPALTYRVDTHVADA